MLISDYTAHRGRGNVGYQICVRYSTSLKVDWRSASIMIIFEVNFLLTCKTIDDIPSNSLHKKKSSSTRELRTFCLVRFFFLTLTVFFHFFLVWTLSGYVMTKVRGAALYGGAAFTLGKYGTAWPIYTAQTQFWRKPISFLFILIFVVTTLHAIAQKWGESHDE